MKKLNLINNCLLYFLVASMQILWIPIAALGFVFWCASAIIEIAHIELCGVVSSMRKRLK
tara:strand:+ start:384 stop:563 length:180 start_codon:yes stop_codon:yes gene_type:complete